MPLPRLILHLALAATGSIAGADPVGDHDVAVQDHCVGCHGGPRPKGRLDLSEFQLSESAPELLTEILERVVSGEMPPRKDGEPLRSFDGDPRESLVRAIRDSLAQLDPDPGRPTLRRLNRHEYGNSVRALLGIQARIEDDLPEDASSEGFDNQGDVLFLTPRIAELFLDATHHAIEEFESTGGPSRLGLSQSVNDTENLRVFLARAFRRTPTPDETYARTVLLQGEDGVRACIASVLLSPHFLFRIEEDREQDTPWHISDWELATRLSYFLWASPPDAGLLDYARSQTLSIQPILDAHVERMLDDPRSRSLSTRFAGRWLGFADLATLGVDTRRFKGTSGRLKRSMALESELFIEAVFREDRSLLELVDSDSTFLNAALAKHYGIEGVKGNKMRRVKLDGRRRGGVLTQASVLTVTSQPLRTSPVQRGAWILDRLFGAPAPPPPADAGSLPADDRQEDGLTQRERLERHRADPSCASCHDRIDPLGFALENYDGIGRWRDEDHVGPIDAMATLPNGRSIDGIIGLKDALLDDPERIVRGITEALLVYALGRPIEPADEPLITSLVEDLRANDWKARTLVRGIVSSYAFQHRRSAR